MQFVKMHADKHIQQIFNGNSIKDSSDLAALYKHAAGLGFSGNDKNPIVEESDDENTNPANPDREEDLYSFDIDSPWDTSRRGNDDD